MADDDDAIYVDVKARLDEASADEAESRLRDKFKDAAKDIGDSIKDATSSIGDHIRDALREGGPLRDIGRDIGSTIGDELKNTIGRDLSEGHVGGALDRIGGAVSGTTGLINDLGGHIGLHLDSVDDFGKKIAKTLDEVGDRIDSAIGRGHSLTDSFHAFRSGDITKGVDNLSDSLRGLVPDSVLENVNGVAQTFTDTHDTIKGLVDTAKDLGKELEPLGFAGLGGVAAGLGEFIPPAALAIAGGTALLGPGGVSDRVAAELYKHNAFGFRNPLYASQGIPVPESALGGIPTPSTATAAIPGLANVPLPRMTPASQLPSFAPYDMPDDPSDPKNMRSNLRMYPVPVPTPVAGGGGSSSVTTQTASITAGSAVISAGSLSLAGVSMPTPQVTVVSPGAAQSAVSPGYSRAMSGLGMGGGGGTIPGLGAATSGLPKAGGGAPSIAPQDHHASGGLLPGSSPGYDNLLADLAGRPIGLEGGEFVVNPEATQAYLPLLKAINMSHFDEGGQVPTDTGGGGQGPIQQQGIGSGKGMTVGGGLLGAAEQAGAMMAGPLAPAAQVAEQEMNLAIQNTGKIIADLAMAPIETLWLGGGQLGARSVGSPAKAGWMGKLLGGVIGEGTSNLQNLAGSVMKPKQPDQPGQQDIHQGPTAQPPAGPQGTADDPMHVKNVGGQPGHPQGATSSWMNMQNPMLNQLSPG